MTDLFKMLLVIGVVKSRCIPCRTQGSAIFVPKEGVQRISTGQSAASLQTASAQRALKVDAKVRLSHVHARQFFPPLRIFVLPCAQSQFFCIGGITMTHIPAKFYRGRCEATKDARCIACTVDTLPCTPGLQYSKGCTADADKQCINCTLGGCVPGFYRERCPGDSISIFVSRLVE